MTMIQKLQAFFDELTPPAVDYIGIAPITVLQGAMIEYVALCCALNVRSRRRLEDTASAPRVVHRGPRRGHCCWCGISRDGT